jgi:NADH-quinone oxidoreductase subunit G
MLVAPRKVYILFGVEPACDMADSDLASQALQAADAVVACAAYKSDDLLECASVLLPISTFAETDGTFINGEGRWQSFEQAARPPGETRAGWKVLRVLGNLLGLPGCEYRSAFELRDELAAELGEVSPETGYVGGFTGNAEDPDIQGIELDVPIYAVDAVVRRSRPLQETKIGQEAPAAAAAPAQAANG